MAPRPRPAPRRPPLAAAVAALALTTALVAGCGGDGSDGGDAGAPAGTTATTPAIPATSSTTTGPAAPGPAGPTTTTAAPGPTTSVAAPGSPSTLPASVQGACAALDQTYGIAALTPRDTGSWVDERQRITTDARREAQLLAAARQDAPPELTVSLSFLEGYATDLAGIVAGAGSYAEATSALGRLDRAGADAAASTVDAWHSSNCGN